MIRYVSGNQPPACGRQADGRAWMRSIADSPSVIVAFSGGADSVLAAHHAAETGKAVTLWYLHHYASPIEPQREKVFAEIQKKYPQLTMVKTQTDVARIAVRLGYSWEHTAALLRRKRLARFRALVQEKAGGKCSVITGHNFSDYVETIALRRERGIPEAALPLHSEVDEITGFLRPLFQLTREEVRQRVAALGLPYFDDPANADERFARNRIRNNPQPTALPAQPARLPVELKNEGARELHLPLGEWSNLSKTEKSRTVFDAFRRLLIVRRFTRNHFDRASRLPFNLAPFFAHREKSGAGEVVVFRRGLGANAAMPEIGGIAALRGDQVSRSITIAMPYGSKSVAKIFSEKKLSPRERRRTLVFVQPGGTQATSILYPEGH